MFGSRGYVNSLGNTNDGFSLLRDKYIFKHPIQEAVDGSNLEGSSSFEGKAIGKGKRKGKGKGNGKGKRGRTQVTKDKADD